MHISEKGLVLIKRYEGLRLKAYQCSAGRWTIGYGHTHNIRAGDVITQQQAEAFLREDIAQVMALLNTQIKVPLTQNQCDALCSLVFNIGATAFAASTLLKKLNFGDYSGAAAEFIKWNKATVNDKKIPLLGLIKRRQVEKALFELA
ncbi:lysozyme [Candidatus Williamhamiltonella defendens]|uniref:Lysozyme n=2 Tax=Candidatus Williamhamiltonella defendens TaxID=138072 RepID=A0A249DXY3_9ENTR|nr:lysozyme [Candidatus Hamiltonella defensa]ACJ10111.1 lysozyme [Bacteriophage APSE-7]ASX26125.1 lysozyme [Candidatus Hamiltonella defensa (Bemisia tabaci)]CED78237.1 Lysozyme [Candidatus Hamiltonella defensa (Bemisia tabaci)]